MIVLLEDKFYEDTEVNVEISSFGIQYGYGVFETMKLTNGELEFLPEHLNRIKNSMEVFGLVHELELENIKKSTIELCHKNKLFDGIVKLSVLKGLSKDYLLLSMRKNMYTSKDYENGYKLCVSDVRKNQTSKLSYHKTCNYMEMMYERKLANINGCDEVLFLNTNEYIAECSISNIFWIKEKTIFTPSIENGILNGIMRQNTIEFGKKLGYEVIESKFKFDLLQSADSVFITNSVIGIMPVSKINNTWYSKDNEILYQLRNR